MVCYFLQRAYRSVEVSPKTGKRPLKFKPQGAYIDLPVMLPCGKCIGCRLEQSRQWAVRCVHESSMHDENSFLTLTYNDEHLPEDGTLVKSHLQGFIKKLRRKTGKELRYYGCGEYGDKLGRPHYHIIVFGYEPKDKEVLVSGQVRRFKNIFSTKIANDLFTSKEIEERWGKGFCTAGSVSFDSAGYVARYCVKKISGDKAISHYGKKIPEFAIMSRKPGLGKLWIEKYLTDVYPKDFFTLDGVKMRPPRYYDIHLEEVNPELMKKIKKRREIKERENYETCDRKHARDKHKKLQTKSLKRRIHNE